MYHISTNVITEIEVKKSRFIGLLLPVETEAEAKKKLTEIRRAYPGATHYCYALICGNIVRSNDDGEPAGTAGMPILNALKQKQLDNVLAVVVRYFGGTLLGTSGLFKAYQQATLQSIEAATLTVPTEVGVYTLKVSYEYVSKIEQLLSQKAVILNRGYDQEVTYLFQSRDDLSDDVARLTSGKFSCVFLRNEIIEL